MRIRRKGSSKCIIWLFDNVEDFRLGSRDMPAKWVRIYGDETGKISALMHHREMLFVHLRLPKRMNNPKFFLPRAVSEEPDVSLKLSANDV